MKKRRKKTGCLHTFVALGGFLCLIIAVLSISYGIGTNVDVVKKIEKKLIMPDKVPYQEVVISEEETVQKFYYQQLEEEERLVYREILDGIRENGKEIYVHTSDAERANAIFQYILKDYPEIFWCDGTITATSYEGEEAYTVLQPTYSYSEMAKGIMEEEMASAIEECLVQVPEESSEYQKILYVYEYIVNTVDYDMAAPDNQNIYSVFKHQRSVCAGYSKAAQYLLERLGVFCTYVTGTTSTGQNHAWNLVKCDGDYYYVDVTWGDPVFQEAEGGTVFLDEIGELSSVMQVKLLRVLQEHEIRPVGGNAVVPVNVRFISATHRDLPAAIKEGSFREDLYYRLAVIRLRLPALRERREDIAGFAGHFVRKYNQRYGRQVARISPAALQSLQAQPWKGNIRELENVMERAVLLADGESVTPGVLGLKDDAEETEQMEELSLQQAVQQAEREAVARALALAGGNRTRAAALLGVSRRTLYDKLEDYGL